MEQRGMPNVCYTGSKRATNFDMVTQEHAASGSKDIAIDSSPTAPNQRLKRNQDEYVPIPNVIKIMRQVLPQHVKIQDESKEIIQECVSEFIAFVTKAANDYCRRDCRKIIKPEDILAAMELTGFHHYIEPLALFLEKYRVSSNSQAPNNVHVQPPPAPRSPEAMSQFFPLPQSQPAIFRPEPRVVQPTAPLFSHVHATAAPSTSTMFQPNADEWSQILDYFVRDQGGQGEGSGCGGSLFDPYNKPLN